MLITPQYKTLNERLHSTRPDYGISGQKWAGMVARVADAMKTTSILDYGSGKGTLGKALGRPISEYDPCIPGKESRPAPAALVVCTDVLEHIEPDCLDAVLDDLTALTLVKGFFVIATRPAKKFLEDGRNAHLIQQNIKWWLDRLWLRFDLEAFQDFGGDFLVIVKHRPSIQ